MQSEIKVVSHANLELRALQTLNAGKQTNPFKRNQLKRCELTKRHQTDTDTKTDNERNLAIIPIKFLRTKKKNKTRLTLLVRGATSSRESASQRHCQIY
jgi:hypothetical protein